MVVGYMVDIWGIIFYVMMGCIICIRIQHCGMYLSKVIMCCLCWPMKIFIKHASPILFIFSKQMQMGRLMEIFLFIILSKNKSHVSRSIT